MLIHGWGIGLNFGNTFNSSEPASLQVSLPWAKANVTLKVLYIKQLGLPKVMNKALGFYAEGFSLCGANLRFPQVIIYFQDENASIPIFKIT